MQNTRCSSLFICLFSVLVLVYQNASSQAKHSKAEWADENDEGEIGVPYRRGAPVPREHVKVQGIEWADEAAGREIYERAMELDRFGSVEHFQCIGPYFDYLACLNNSADDCSNAAGDFCGNNNIEWYTCTSCAFYTAPPTAIRFDEKDGDTEKRHPGCAPESGGEWHSELTFACSTPSPKAKSF